MDTNNQNNYQNSNSSMTSSAASSPASNSSPTSNTPLSSGGMSMNDHKKVGPIVAVLIVIIALIVAGLYFFAMYTNNTTAPVPVTNTTSQNTIPANGDQSAAASAAPQVPQVTNKSDDLQTIQADLNASTQNVDSQSF